VADKIRSFRREIWGYAVLLIILFSIATIAVWQTIAYFQSIRSDSPDDLTVPAIMWSLTLGFMLIAGAYGLWAIKFSAQAESRRRIGRFVDAMSYFKDGLVAVDKKGRITGSNPAAATITNATFEKNTDLAEVCPYLSNNEITLLLLSTEPAEVERSIIMNGTTRTLRFRSNPSEDLRVITISDVTDMNAQQAYNRQKARLQLVGQLGRGMAHDFNRLLFEISGHVSLVSRLKPGSPEMNVSLEALRKNVENGIALAGHLLELSQPDVAAHFTESAEMHVNRAVRLLGDSLTRDWRTEISVNDELPAIGLTGIQLEQVIFNLGLLAADNSPLPGTIRIAVMKPSTEYLASTGLPVAGLILLTTSSSDITAIAGQPGNQQASGESGVILSVVRSIIDEAGGSLECLKTFDGAPVYRVALPHGNIPRVREDSVELPAEIKSYISQWSILLAAPAKEIASLQQTLRTIGAKVEHVDTIVSVLARIEEENLLDAMIISNHLLGQETKGLLKAILKLRPSVGIVVLCEDLQIESESMTSDIIFESTRSTPNKILTSMLEARSLAATRKRR